MVAKNEHSDRSGCPVACALDIIGDHWTLLIVRDLMFLDKHEYKELIDSAEGISTNILSERLKKLECHEMIASIPHPESKKRKLYYLTNKGKDLIHTMVDIARWSEKHLSDLLDIPAERKKLLLKDPEGLKQMTLEQLKNWEKIYLAK